MLDFEPRQERDIVATRTLVRIALVAIAVGVAAVGAEGTMLRWRTRSREPSYEAPQPPGTVEHSLVEETLRGPDLQMRQREELGRVQWADDTHKTAKIPIERAIDLYVANPDGGRP